MPDRLTEATVKRDHALAAMCIMEEIVDPCYTDAPRPWEVYRELHGIGELRAVVIDRLAPAADAAWDRAWERHNARHDDDPAKNREPGSFDYEFVPVWLRECVDWSDDTNGPRVRGSAA